MTDRIRIVPTYHSPAHYITEPDKIVGCSRYFVRRWMPLLGGTGTQIVIALRSLGYYNYRDGETRDGIEIDIPELAALVGVCEATIKREFGEARRGKYDAPDGPRRLQNPTLHLFVKKDRQYWRDPVTNRLLRTANVYRVMMDDPIHPEDAARYREIVEGVEKGLTPTAQNAPKMPRAKQTPKAPIAPLIPGDSASNAPMEPGKSPMVTKRSPMDSRNGPMEPTLIGYSSLQKKTPDTPAAPGDSLSLFEEKKEDVFPEADRPLWEERARRWFVSNGVPSPGTRAVARQAVALWRHRREGADPR